MFPDLGLEDLPLLLDRGDVPGRQHRLKVGGRAQLVARVYNLTYKEGYGNGKWFDLYVHKKALGGWGLKNAHEMCFFNPKHV